MFEPVRQDRSEILHWYGRHHCFLAMISICIPFFPVKLPFASCLFNYAVGIVNSYWIRYALKLLWSNLSQYPKIWLEGLKNTTINLSLDSGCSGGDSDCDLPEHKREAFSLDATWLIPGPCHRVVGYVGTNISEEYIASVFRVSPGIITQTTTIWIQAFCPLFVIQGCVMLRDGCTPVFQWLSL
jgi:hypothetical protein